MKVAGNEIRPGMVIMHQDGLWTAVKTMAVKPGKGGAYNQVELKNLIDGRKLNERFRAAETVERVRLEERDFQYVYKDGEMLCFMDLENYEQVSLSQEFIGDDQVAFLEEGMKVILVRHEERYIGCQLPQHVTRTVAETEPAIKNQTATSSFKPAILDNGVRTNIPPFISVGERVVVNTETLEYVKRAD